MGQTQRYLLVDICTQDKVVCKTTGRKRTKITREKYASMISVKTQRMSKVPRGTLQAWKTKGTKGQKY